MQNACSYPTKLKYIKTILLNHVLIIIFQELEKALCDHVRSRIDNLTESGIEGIWMKSVGDDIYNAGTILGYRGDNWDSILKYSGLCMSDGRCDFRTWPKKLTSFDVETRIFDTDVSGRVSWFRFCRVIVEDSKRSLRSGNVAHISGDDTMTALLQTRSYSISYKGHMYS